MLVDLEPQTGERLQIVPLPFPGRTAVQQVLIGKEQQPARSSDGWIQNAEGTSGGIAGIGKKGQILFLALPVYALKFAPSEDYLAACLHQAGRRCRWQVERYGPNGAGVFRHVLSDSAIAAGDGARQLPICIVEGERKAVELELGNVLDFLQAAKLPHPPIEVRQFP